MEADPKQRRRWFEFARHWRAVNVAASAVFFGAAGIFLYKFYRSEIIVVAIVCLAISKHAAGEGPICPSCPITFREQIGQSEAAIIGRPIAGAKGNAGSATYEVTKIVTQPAAKAIRVGDSIVVDWPVTEGTDLVFATANLQGDGRLVWSPPAKVTNLSVDYIVHMSKLRNDDIKPLSYCIGLIESTDAVVGEDVHSEVGAASLDDLLAAKGAMSRDRLEALVVDNKTARRRLGIYGLMLGVCGDKQSEQLLRNRIKVSGGSSDPRQGLEQIMFGYLLLAGENGVDTLSREILANPKASFVETYSAVYAIKALWRETPNRVRLTKLRKAIHPLLEHKIYADLGVSSLALMRDWTIQDRLVAMYAIADQYADPELLREAIVKFMEASARDVPDRSLESSARVTKAREFLHSIEKSSP